MRILKATFLVGELFEILSLLMPYWSKKSMQLSGLRATKLLTSVVPAAVVIFSNSFLFISRSQLYYLLCLTLFRMVEDQINYNFKQV